MQWTSRRATVLGIGAAAVLAVGFLSAPASNAQTSVDDNCAELIGAGDNFAEACDTELAAMDDSGAIPGVDEIVSSPNLRQVANLPKQAPFDTTSAYGTDIAFQGQYAFVGNYNGFTIYDIRKPAQPEDRLPGALPRVAERHLGLRRPALPLHRLLPQRRLLRQRLAVRGAEGVVGGHQDLRHQRQGNPRYIKSVETALRLAHPHPGAGQGRQDGLPVRLVVQPERAEFPDCQPPHDSISIVKVPVKKPTTATVVATPNLFPDGGFRADQLGDHRLPRHHRLPGEGPRRRRLHG